MEKTLVIEHNGEKAVVWEPPQIFSKSDYDLNVLEKALEKTEGPLKEWRKRKFQEYKEWGFPKWKRCTLDGLKLPELSFEYVNENVRLSLLENLDFEGSHRKFVLLADTFFTSFKVFGDGTHTIRSEKDGIENYLITVEKNAKIFKISKTNRFKDSVMRILVKRGATLKFVNVDLFGDFSFDNILIFLEEGSTLIFRDFKAFGNRKIGHVLVKMEKRSTADMKSFFYQNGKGITDVLYLMRFIGEEAEGKLKGNGIVDDSGKVVFRGILDVKRGAKNAVAEEVEHTLLLSPNAKMDAIPSLWVDENEVTASHSASSSSLDENELFYLMSRGLEELEAKKLIVRGIFCEILDEIDEPMRGEVEDVINRIV
ncbi:SufD family Fe-S cluster assembly protein [Thermotoga sp. KOL6]|uniref:SufD family Fe-S cluster assembly protein n=1 Tax=Thermotoga sp. KOL6 TaxID=126741 RepID=UPI000C7565EB|nr:SufD family Fe-S cluster assembly protein [Thermotoga sp. KOL6]PLV60021.1 Fe-S cluster assembly protein SufD [Thermotoga sp. KOL6]